MRVPKETTQDAAENRYGQGLPPAGGWKLAMREDPTEYSPEFQDEYRWLWHEAAADRDHYLEALSGAGIASAGGSPRDATTRLDGLRPVEAVLMSEGHHTTPVLLPARCVQVGDRLRGRRVVSVEPGVGKAVQITTDDGRFVNFHMDENVRIHRV